MAFTEVEKQALLELKGVGPTVVKRFEEIGIDSFNKLAAYDAKTIAEMVASMLRTTCWKNSPQALSAVDSAIARAKQG
ncbi:helix-hairpin-helix domain-containing protein [Marinimicrobium sp. ABcell2]|uniref:helix-hairpin-helix domain-containing protein n=1 Tax=Marinimicrobium sp. ABcell2 TaxID=3069751 RepID=UPI0027B1AA27|nr:helix-hairpin-helix domain-containing protein [Marinimicrobium sp. ABcell2]MDQ2077739.1 helix-hairpin-helix domain-containing protein [Marinimicrobium sp. ABcell2]